MSWNWVEYVHLAKEIAPSTVTSERDRARVRSVVSRAYYAAFHRSKEYALRKGWTKDPKIKHGALWQLFLTRDRSEDEKEIGSEGDRLMDDRRDADYESVFSCGPKTCKSAVDRADKILSLLQTAPPPTP